MTATWSESGLGTSPTIFGGVPGWNDCTDALPSSPLPPAITRYAPLTTAPAASCTGCASDPSACDAPFDGSTRTTLPVVCFDASRPPSTVRPLPSVSTTSREDGDGSFQGAGSIRTVPAPVVAGADDGVVAAALVASARFDVLPPSPPHAATSRASAPSTVKRRTERGTTAPLHTKRGGPESGPHATIRIEPVGSSGQPG